MLAPRVRCVERAEPKESEDPAPDRRSRGAHGIARLAASAFAMLAAMSSRTFPRRAGLALVALATSCAPAAPTPTVAPHALVTPSGRSAPPAERPARWSQHPPAPATMHARLDLGPAGVLFAGDDGERWLDRPTGPVPAGPLLPEAIVAIARGAGALVFVGASGATYAVAAADPLGPVVARHAPPAPMRSVVAGPSAILGVSAGAAMRSSDGGATWSKLAMPKTAGTLVQLAMLPTGEGLALFAPQRVLVTTDEGATWAALGTPGVGARRVVADVNGDLLLEGLETSAILRKNPLRLEKIGRAPTRDPELVTPTATVPRPSYAWATGQGRGAFLGERWVELVGDADDDSAHWRLVDGKLGAAPTSRKLPELDGCDSVLLAAAPGGESLEFGCEHPADPPPEGSAFNPNKKPKPSERRNLRLLRSDDGGKTLHPDGIAFASDSSAKRLWLSSEGVLIVQGACKPTRQEWGCEESPPVVRAPGATAFAKVVGIPNTTFGTVLFAPDHTRAWAVGAINSGGRLGLYASHDGGRDFTRKNIPAVMRTPPDVAPPPTLDANAPVSLAVDADGTVRVAAFDGEGWTIYVTHDDGATFDSRPLPFAADAVQLVGARGLAWSHDGVSRETGDGGVTWHEVDAPHLRDPQTPLVCGAYGCQLGERTTRVGWDDVAGTASAPEPKPDRPKLASATPLRCEATGTWTSLGTVALPSSGNLDLGGGSRFVVPRRNKDGGVSVVVGGRPKDPTKPSDRIAFEEVTLFGPSPADTATASTLQLEGVAAMRYTFKRESPLAKKKGSKPAAWGAVAKDQLVDVEVAWYLAETRKVHRATLKGVGPLQPGDLLDGRDKPSIAQYALLSIALGGIHVRPFAKASKDAPLWFVSDAGKVDKLTWPELPVKDVRGRALALSIDAGRVGGRSVVFAYPARSDVKPSGGLQMITAWANATGSAWASRTWGLWPDDDEGTARLRYIDSAKTAAFAVLYDDGAAGTAAWTIPLAAPDADPTTVLPLPTAAALGDRPKLCDKAAAIAARVSIPHAKGTRHPVFVTGEGSGELLLATRESVVRVPEGEACVSAWEAFDVQRKSADAIAAAIAPDDLGHAVLFRTKAGETSARPLSCVWAEGAAIPEELRGVEGFVR